MNYASKGYIDFHSHILPGVDDGPETASESIEILRCLYDEGVRTVVSTSHFYLHSESMEDFLRHRERGYQLLTAEAEKQNAEIPEIILGAEVLFTHSLLEIQDIEKLCIGNTKYILIELPYQSFSSIVFDSLQKFILNSGLKPVMAHVERYKEFNKLEKLYELADFEVLCQVNCSSIVKRSTRKMTLQLLKDNAAYIIGSDVHNLTSRPPMYDEAVKIICHKLSDKKLNEIQLNAEMILNNARLDDII